MGINNKYCPNGARYRQTETIGNFYIANYTQSSTVRTRFVPLETYSLNSLI
jgi:hypothetical protein